MPKSLAAWWRLSNWSSPESFSSVINDVSVAWRRLVVEVAKLVVEEILLRWKSQPSIRAVKILKIRVLCLSMVVVGGGGDKENEVGFSSL